MNPVEIKFNWGKHVFFKVVEKVKEKHDSEKGMTRS